ncbi:MAG: SEC-C metal-binding domain-containing protein, partial [Enterovibrio sp.]
GSSRFYLSMEDPLMRIFASDRVTGMMKKLGMEEGESIEHPWVNKAIENAQRKVEGRNFDIRKQLLEFDDVANDQRRVVYELRDELMDCDDISEMIQFNREDVITAVISEYIPAQSFVEMWDLVGLERRLKDDFELEVPVQEWFAQDNKLDEVGLRDKVLQVLLEEYQQKELHAGKEVLRHFEKAIMLQTLDTLWKEHLAAMDHLRQGIHLRGYAQKNPKQEYKRESFALFERMLDVLKADVISTLSKVRVQQAEEVDKMEAQRDEMAAQMAAQQVMNHVSFEALSENETGEESAMPAQETVRKVGRNEPCPCASGKKYKQCHGQLG